MFFKFTSKYTIGLELIGIATYTLQPYSPADSVYTDPGWCHRSNIPGNLHLYFFVLRCLKLQIYLFHKFSFDHINWDLASLITEIFNSQQQWWIWKSCVWRIQGHKWLEEIRGFAFLVCLMVAVAKVAVLNSLCNFGFTPSDSFNFTSSCCGTVSGNSPPTGEHLISRCEAVWENETLGFLKALSPWRTPLLPFTPIIIQKMETLVQLKNSQFLMGLCRNGPPPDLQYDNSSGKTPSYTMCSIFSSFLIA